MQKTLQDEGAIRHIYSHILDAGYESIFLIAGNHFLKENKLNFLQGLEVESFVKVGTNVTNDEVDMVFNEYKKKSHPVIVAIGGGSVIDLAKTVIYRCIESLLTVPYFIAAPTTAGSGSEATQFSVLYKGKKKFSWDHPALLPKIVILDSALTYSLSRFQTAVSGMDVLAQAIESYWNIHATKESKSYSTESIVLWKQYFPEVVTNPVPVSRERMLFAAHLAGKAINITRTTGPHALSYYLTADHHIPHGQAVAIFLPVFFIYNRPQEELCGLLQVKNEAEAKEFIQTTMKQAGVATRFEELGLDKKKIMDDLLATVNEERFANNPRPFNRTVLEELFNKYL